ncbi:hypothetical protein MYD38_004627, partial [Vibrio parahaemolyticus]|nr:hypothetical protein [Vibrio parahaemolyticus]
NNKKTGVRRLRNVLAHANLSKFNIRFGNEELLYPLTENDNCQLLYQKLSGIIFNIMLKVAALNLTVDISVNVDSEIKALKLSIIEFSPEDILIDKGIDPATLDGWQDLKVSDQYRIAENAQNVKVLTHIFSGLADEWKCTHNKAFKSDSQRLAVSLRSSIAKRRSHLNAALALGWNQRSKVLMFIGFFFQLYT